MRMAAPLSIVALALSSCGLTNDLDLTVQANEGGQLFITNAGSSPIKIQDITVNGRKDCTMAREFGGFVDKPSVARDEKNNPLQIIFTWSVPDDPFIQEHVSESGRHQQWVSESGYRFVPEFGYRFIETQDGNYHANICAAPEREVYLYHPLSDDRRYYRTVLVGARKGKPELVLEPVLVWHRGGCSRRIGGGLSCDLCERPNIRRVSYDLRFRAIELQVGDSINRTISCNARIVNVTVTTDRGSAEYRFQ